MREALTWVRSSVVAVLSRLESVVGDSIRELGSLVSIKVIGSWSGRGQMAAFIIRGKTISIITMGSNVRTAAWGPDLEDSWRRKMSTVFLRAIKIYKHQRYHLRCIIKRNQEWMSRRLRSATSTVSGCFTQFLDLRQVSDPEAINGKGSQRAHARMSAQGLDADQQDRGLHEEGGQAERWPPGVRLLIIFRGLQQVSKYIEHNGSQISFSWERQKQINTGKAVNPVGLALNWNWSYRCKLMVFNIYIEIQKYPYLSVCICIWTQIHMYTDVYTKIYIILALTTWGGWGLEIATL